MSQGHLKSFRLILSHLNAVKTPGLLKNYGFSPQIPYYSMIKTFSKISNLNLYRFRTNTQPLGYNCTYVFANASVLICPRIYKVYT